MRAIARIKNSPWSAYSFALGAVLCYGSSSALAKDLIETYGPPLVIASFSHLFGVGIGYFFTKSTIFSMILRIMGLSCTFYGIYLFN